MEKTENTGNRLDQSHRDALTLVESLWSSLDWEKLPQRLHKQIYSLFQDWIQGSAYTGSLQTFVSNFGDVAVCGVVPGPWAEHVAAIMSGGMDREVLQILREETAALIIYMRARRDQGKEAKRTEFMASRTGEEKEHLAKFEKMQKKQAGRR